jgi:hypothetical protein
MQARRSFGPSLGAATLLGGVLGASYFLALTTTRIIDPTEIGWLMKFDWATHYFGWKYFRYEPWQWPPGTVHGYNAPIGTAIGLTDSLPLVAYVLKPFSRWMPEDVQYLGAWELLCFALQGAIGARLIGRWVPYLLPMLLGAALFVMAPVLLGRVAHAALCAHWLIFWCFLLAMREARTAFRWWEWAALGLLSGMIQPYLAAMVAVLLAACVLQSGTAAWRDRLAALAAAAATMLFGWWVSGIFNLGGVDQLSALGLGVFSANLLAPITSQGASRILPDLPRYGGGQDLEGFNYFGLGVLLLIVVSMALSWHARRTATTAPPKRLWSLPIVLACVLLAALAISPRVTFGDRVVVDLLGPWASPLALFRSSGRFLWPLGYAVLTSAIVAVMRHAPPRVGVVVLAAAVVVQAFDLSQFYLERAAGARSPIFHEWHDPFTSSRWTRITPYYKHLVLWPPPQCGTAPIPIENALQFAAARRLTVNTGTLSRGSEIARARYCDRMGADIAAGTLDPEALYLVSAEMAAHLGKASDRNRCGTLDTLTICSTTATYPVWQHLVAR